MPTDGVDGSSRAVHTARLYLREDTSWAVIDVIERADFVEAVAR